MFRLLNRFDLQDAYRLESKSFPADEAASLESIEFRITKAPDLIFGMLENDKLIGLCMATRILGDKITNSSMKSHDEAGTTICIHSVCIDPTYRRQGKGLELLTTYLKYLKTLKHTELILLITKEYLIPFYMKCGFELVGISTIVHGNDQWYEMRIKN